MLVIVCYDVKTDTGAGRRRLRRIAKVCEGNGQRVQKSVFECRVDRAGFEALERRLLAEIDLDEDNLRVYCIGNGRDSEVHEYGTFRAVDFDGPLVL